MPFTITARLAFAYNRAGLNRILSAYRQVGRGDFADAVLDQLKGPGIQLKTEETPFNATPVLSLGQPGKSPLYARVRIYKYQLLIRSQHQQKLAAKGLFSVLNGCRETMSVRPSVAAWDFATSSLMAATVLMCDFLGC